MNKLVLILSAFLMMSGAASAAPTLLGSIAHDYGVNKYDPGGGDALIGDYVQVSDSSNPRFFDNFDFSSLNASSVSELQLTLTFSHTNNYFFFIFPEAWHVHPANATDLRALARVGSTPYVQTFSFTASDPSFAAAIADETFKLWFADEALGNNSFRLYDATVAVYGEAAQVPVPATLALLGLSAFGFFASRRRKV